MRLCSGGEISIKGLAEAYVGEYASGKSEVAINRALELLALDREVTLVDLDLVEPFYTLRPLKRALEEKGLRVVAWETSQTIGLGEAGNVIKPEMRWVLRRNGDVILDVGYGVDGLRTLNLLEETQNRKDLKVYVVVNVGRPMTSSVEDIVAYVSDMGKVDGLINNSHLGDETTADFVQNGAVVVKNAADILNIPLVATYAEERLLDALGTKDITGTPVKGIKRHMKTSFW